MPLPPELFDVSFLIKSGWTYDEYLEAPQEVITKMVILWNAEAEVTRARMNEAKG